LSLLRRWIAVVRDDDDLLEACLEAHGKHVLVLARNYWDRVTRKQVRRSISITARSRQQARRQRRLDAALLKTATKVRAKVFAFTAENGKKIAELNGHELVQLQTSNAGRAMLYRELGRRVKGEQIVGEVLDAEQFKSIVNRIGDVKELTKLFG
jgi:hypothetical protein